MVAIVVVADGGGCVDYAGGGGGEIAVDEACSEAVENIDC